MRQSNLPGASEGQLEVHRCQVAVAVAENEKQMRQAHAAWVMV